MYDIDDVCMKRKTNSCSTSSTITDQKANKKEIKAE